MPTLIFEIEDMQPGQTVTVTLQDDQDDAKDDEPASVFAIPRKE